MIDNNDISNIKIGVVGQGFVGSAVSRAFSTVLPPTVVLTYDKFKPELSSALTTSDLVRQGCNVVFVCVPTPMFVEDGTCDTSIVEEVIAEIDRAAFTLHRKPIVVIKSTVPPGTTKMLQDRCGSCTLIFNPEFLNARSAYEDFLLQTYVILGCDDMYTRASQVVSVLYQHLLGPVEVVMCDSITAEMVKYTKNSFFAVKMSYANEVWEICQKLNVDYTKMIDIAQLDDRMGWEHWKVPGPTAKARKSDDEPIEYVRGWGGPCICKDINAFMNIALECGVDPKIMMAAWQKNLEIRPERDWELIQSAVSFRKNDK